MAGVPVVLALDIATTTGVCFGPIGAQPPLLQWGSRDFSGAGKSNGEIIALFRGWVAARCYAIRPSLIIMESPYVPVGSKPGGGAPMNPNTLRRLLGMTGAVEAIGWELKTPVREVVSAAFTKFITGKGQYKKREEKKAAVIAACRFLGCDVRGNDEADAVAIWLFAEGILSPRAAEHRRRLAADRDRELNGAGPLFGHNGGPPLGKENAPQGASLRSVMQPLASGESHGAKMQVTYR